MGIESPHQTAVRSIGVPLLLSMLVVPLAYGQTADTVYAFVPSEGIGNIAVRIEVPSEPRYPDGAPVVVEVGTWFVSYNEFHRVNDTKRIGAVTIAYLWPGRLDAESGLHSDGEYDYGGPISLAALKDVIRFASGVIPDADGNMLGDLAGMPVLTDNLGLFASSHAGVVATNVLAYFGESIPTVKYLVGRENPTRDEMYPLELGFFDGSPNAENRIENPFYNETAYFADTVFVDYSTVGWYQPEGQETGHPYFAATDSLEEHILFHDKTPRVENKRYYSRNLTHALRESDDLTEETWPDYVGTPAEVDSFWPYRICVHNYSAIEAALPALRVMLVFARYDHVQAAPTKPHVHQAWDGFHDTAGLWVRMNPDLAYVQSLDPGYGFGFPDNRANDEPFDWIFIEDWGFPADPPVRHDMWLASVAEMADRLYFDNWDADLDSVFLPVIIDTAGVFAEPFGSGLPGSRFTRLEPIRPNPCNSATAIPVYVEHAERVKLSIYDMKGDEVRVLFSGVLPGGGHVLRWSAIDLPSGAYICQLRSPEQVHTRRIIVQK